MSHVKNALGGILLIAGTCVGAGTLAMPIGTASLGYGYSIAFFVLCWGFMTLSALLMLECNLRSAPGSNLISMAEQYLGPLGKVVAWIAYLMLLYSLTSAYLNGAAGWVSAQLQALLGIELSMPRAAGLLTLLICLVIYSGPKTADWTNRFLMLGLAVAFAVLIACTVPAFSPPLVTAHDGVFSVRSLPLLLTAFGYHIVIPTLTTYIRCDRTLRGIILTGALIPLILYVMWETWVFGLLSSAQLQSIAADPNTTAALSQALESIGHTPVIGAAANAFTIFVITTSFIGVCLSLFDFLADGLKIAGDTVGHRIGLTVITCVPCLLFVVLFPAGFLFALSFAGIFVALLLGIYPALMAWQARYHGRTLSDYTVWGGKPLLLLVLMFFACVMGIEIMALATRG